jgi:hypothetical protein
LLKGMQGIRGVLRLQVTTIIGQNDHGVGLGREVDRDQSSLIDPRCIVEFPKAESRPFECISTKRRSMRTGASLVLGNRNQLYFCKLRKAGSDSMSLALLLEVGNTHALINIKRTFKLSTLDHTFLNVSGRCAFDFKYCRVTTVIGRISGYAFIRSSIVWPDDVFYEIHLR